MTTHRQLVGRITMGLLLIVMAAACDRFGPQLNIDIENEGPKKVTMTFDSPGRGEEVTVLPRGTGMAWSEPLPSTWEVRIDGKHVIGSDDRTDLALPSPGQRQDVMIRIQVDADGTVRLLDAP